MKTKIFEIIEGGHGDYDNTVYLNCEFVSPISGYIRNCVFCGCNTVRFDGCVMENCTFVLRDKENKFATEAVQNN